MDLHEVFDLGLASVALGVGGVRAAELPVRHHIDAVGIAPGTGGSWLAAGLELGHLVDVEIGEGAGWQEGNDCQEGWFEEHDLCGNVFSSVCWCLVVFWRLCSTRLKVSQHGLYISLSFQDVNSKRA